MNNEWDDLYVDKVVNGDREAFRYFVKNYQQMAFSVAISIVKTDENAKDVVQNAFVSAYKRIKSYRKESKFSTWLYRIVVNEALKTQRRSKSRKNLEETFSHSRPK